MFFLSKFRFTESPREEKTMKRLICTILVTLGVIGGGFAFAPSAFADTSTTCYTDSNGTTFCNTQVGSVSYGEVSTSAVSIASSDVKGKVNLEFQNPKGFKTNARCPTVNSFAAGVKYKCFVVSKKMLGKHYSNSGVNRSGQRVYFDGYVGDKYTPVGSRFYWDARNHTWRKGNCGNFVRFNHLPKLKVAHVALVKTFSAILVTAKATQTATESVTSTASCSANGTSASATAHGTGTATGTALASARAMTKSKAIALANNQAKSLVTASAYAAAYAAAQVNMYSQAWVSCSNNQPPPPQQTPPSIVTMTILNDVDAGGTSPNFCATVNVPGSDPGTLTFAAQYGSFTTSTFNVSGQQQQCTTYVAPTEVPPGGRDTVTVFVRDNTTGLSAQQSESFPINAPAVHPA